MYCTEFFYNVVSQDNNLSKEFVTREQIQGALSNKANTWDIVQSDWNQTGTSEPDYIKNKPTIPVLPNNIVTANQALSIAVVSSMPASPDANTVYLVTGS